MRQREDELIDPEIAEQLDAIDATLAGEPVAPRFAELAELALLLRAERPEGMRAEFAAELDERVAGRFGRGGAGALAGRPAPSPSPSPSRSPAPAPSRGRRWRFGLAPALGSAAVAVVAVVVAVGVIGGSGGSSDNGARLLSALPARGTSTTLTYASSAAGALIHSRSSAAAKQAILGTAKTHASGTGSGGNYAVPVPERLAPVSPPPSIPIHGAAGSINGTLSPAPLPNGRKVVQSSMLQLGTPARRIDAVAQEVFYVVRAVSAIVESSTVSSTGGPGANAQFQLRVPSPALAQALSQLSRLRYASVISRTDNTQDVNSPYLSDEREITALTTELVKLRAELSATTIQTQIATLRGRIAVARLRSPAPSPR